MYKQGKRPPSAKNQTRITKSKLLKGGWREQWRYAWRIALSDMWRQPLTTLLTVMVIAISLALPSICYIVWKNVHQAATQWYPAPQLTVYLDKTLNDAIAEKVVVKLKREQGVATANYLSRNKVQREFRNWSGFSNALDMLDENPLPAVVILTPAPDFQSTDAMTNLRDRVAKTQGVDEVKMVDSWYTRLSALTRLAGQVAIIIGMLMGIAVLLITGNSIRLTIFSRRDTINVQKLIGATDGFILRPFLYGGAFLGLAGALLSLLLSELVVSQLDFMVTQVAAVFGSAYFLHGMGWEEALLLILIATIIGWISAWLATVQHLRQFTPG